MKGKFLAVLLTLSLCLGLMACASQSSTSTESDATATSQETGVTEETEASDANNTTASNNETEYPALRVKDNLTVGYVVMDVKADSQMRSLWQAKIECARRGWTFVDGSCEGDELTRDAINNLINQDVDVIVLGCMALMDAKVDLIQKAREAGIGVYCNDNQVVEGVVAGSTMRNGAATVDLLYQVCNDYNWDLNCCITYENNQVNLERYKVGAGLMDNVYPNLKFLAADDTTATSTFYLQAAYDYTQTWIQKYGDDLDCIFSPGMVRVCPRLKRSARPATPMAMIFLFAALTAVVLPGRISATIPHCVTPILSHLSSIHITSLR